MKLSELIKVLSDGTACFSIVGLCEEYTKGLEQLQQESWYLQNKEKTVRKITVIGGYCDYNVEFRIRLNK